MRSQKHYQSSASIGTRPILASLFALMAMITMIFALQMAGGADLQSLGQYVAAASGRFYA